MSSNRENNELFQGSQLILLISYTIFSVILIGESLLMGWEIWALFLIAFGVILSWIMHLTNSVAPDLRIWMYSFLMMGTFFFYGVHRTSTFDLAIVISAVIILYTMTARKRLITLAQWTYYATMAYEIITMVIDGESFDALIISRTVLHFCMITMICWFARTIIDKWEKVLGRSKDEIVQLTEATERLNDFLANVSHEIRTPVNAIIGLTGICIDKTKNDEVRNDMISVRNAGRKVAEQISDILDYSELDREKSVTNCEDYMLSSVLHDLVIEIKQYKAREVELIIDVDPAIPSVMNSDVSKIKKILKALISNGLKYTRQGGVYVRITAEEHDYGVNLCFEITDTGIGMTEEELENVYNSFYQADSGRSRMGGGLGLGLAIVSGFVSILGGFMTITSKKDVGTTVCVSIPQKVIDPASCMSVSNPGSLCLGAFLQFEKYPNPQVREYYNAMVMNIVKGLGVQMHRVNNMENLKLLTRSVKMTHLFVGEEEYCSDIEFMEELAREMIVVVVSGPGLVLPAKSNAKIMEKPFYCFPVVSILNSDIRSMGRTDKKMMCRDVKALVVDDEPMNLVVAKSIFKRYGMIVTTVSSGQESVDICREQVFDIIFMDHMMAGMDGVAAMKRIKSDVSGLNSDVPVIALTANAMSSAKQMFLNEGFDGFVSKPIEIEELERSLRQILPKTFITYEDADEAAVIPEVEEPVEKAPEKTDIIPLHEVLKEAGIDTGSGLRYCMDDFDFYKTLLTQVATEATEKIPQLEHYFAEKDWSNYEILIHAVKSTTKMIGGQQVSDEALALETAAKGKDISYIEENHSSCITKYKALSETVLSALGLKNEVTSASESSSGDDEEVMEFGPGDDVLEFMPDDSEDNQS
ncbi:MAG: response regulator [Saccharofermentans sp.]|nr:response regulator [Saccharofermentans sp.]